MSVLPGYELEQKKKKKKSKNPINESGKKLEKKVRDLLTIKDINFKEPKGKGLNIDFIIYTNEGSKYVECKNQNSDGSVDEKIPFTVWKYKSKYKINHMIIIHGNYIIKPLVKKCVKDLMPDIEVEYYNFYQFGRYIEGKKINGLLEELSCIN